MKIEDYHTGQKFKYFKHFDNTHILMFRTIGKKRVSFSQTIGSQNLTERQLKLLRVTKSKADKLLKNGTLKPI